jgi:glycosyltransferase involved in cell wall biosynthesis
VLLHRHAASLASANVPVSHYLARRLTAPRTTVIYNPIVPQAFETVGTDSGHDGLVAFAGRLVQEKRLDLLLRATAMLPDVHVEVAGDGPMRGLWEALARALGVTNRVRFLGTLSFEGVSALYHRAAIVCVPSAWDEPFGYAAAEAMAIGRPVVGTPRGALPELLGDGRGFVAAATTPVALATSLATALSNPAARLRAAAAARAFAMTHLHINAIGAAYQAVYRRALLA